MESKTYLTSTQAREFLNLSRSAFYRLVANGTIPRCQIKNTRIYRYNKNELANLFK